ncbi:histidine-rich protein PFHRP-II-like [Gigantopelta aegis]|uniref:histidine-rich protein PFHRP-II-like n=1 Tax=Gigantopelta aegis TaxID=1735272 RepID=UPI001B88A069|nr:histidine-rich protein PFHRP-II-like [Gigantopelta aegis]
MAAVAVAPAAVVVVNVDTTLDITFARIIILAHFITESYLLYREETRLHSHDKPLPSRTIVGNRKTLNPPRRKNGPLRHNSRIVLRSNKTVLVERDTFIFSVTVFSEFAAMNCGIVVFALIFAVFVFASTNACCCCNPCCCCRCHENYLRNQYHGHQPCDMSHHGEHNYSGSHHGEHNHHGEHQHDEHRHGEHHHGEHNQGTARQVQTEAVRHVVAVPRGHVSSEPHQTLSPQSYRRHQQDYEYVRRGRPTAAAPQTYRREPQDYAAVNHENHGKTAQHAPQPYRHHYQGHRIVKKDLV